jgi:peptidoglycan/LPS O-acetylase OafA/YrhL
VSETLKAKRILVIDALRGIAALGVMFYHFYTADIFVKKTEIVWETPESFLLLPLKFGFSGVYLFFVISGFCIHLRWVKEQLAQTNEQSLDFFAFWKRRFRRLYPAYLAALCFYLAWQWLQNEINFSAFWIWDVVSHLLMIHNFDNRTAFSLNAVFWTLAIEEQLYLAYFALIWLRLKLGWKKTIAICFLCRAVWFAADILLLKFYRIDIPDVAAALPNWFIWALGAIAVEAAFGLIKLPKWLSSLRLATVILIATAILNHFYDNLQIPGRWLLLAWLVIQPMWGVGFFILVNRVIAFEWKEKQVWQKWLIAVFAGIGLFSYSLYLMHEFVIKLFTGVHWTVLALICLVFAWVFYRVFEKPFIRSQWSVKPV